MSSAYFWKLSWKMLLPNTAALTRWEFRLDVQTVPTCLKPIYLVTQECETEDIALERGLADLAHSQV